MRFPKKKYRGIQIVAFWISMPELIDKKGKMSLEDIADCVPSLSLGELKELEAEITQLA